jgi:prevent-host-death family protein
VYGQAPEQYNIHEAKTQLSRIIERVEQGAEVVICRSGKPVARVLPLRVARRTGRGTLAGQLYRAPDWDSAATNAAIADDFGL